MKVFNIIKNIFIINDILDFLIILMVFIACFEIFILLKYYKNKGRNIIKAIIIIFLLFFIAFALYEKHFYQEEVREKIISRQEFLERRWKEEAKLQFNDQFDSYRGVQTGSQMRALLTRTKSNINNYIDQPERVPTVIFYANEDEKTVIGTVTKKTLEGKPYLIENGNTQYINDIEEIRKMIKDKHSYSMIVREDDDGYIRAFAIGDVTYMTKEQISVAEETMDDELMQLELYEKNSKNSFKDKY